LNASSGLPSSGMSSPATSTPPSTSIQFVVFCSSKEARVISLPSHVCISKQKIFDSLGSSASNITRASVVKIAGWSKRLKKNFSMKFFFFIGSPCLTCYLSAGRILVYSLPSLRELYTTNLDPVIDSIRSMIGLTFIFTNRGHGLYMCSPTEIQKITISSDVK
jgi:syntaxin-binding protein 5